MTIPARLLAGLASLVLLISISKAQTGFSTIRGAITDSTGAVVIGAQISVVDVQTNVARSTLSGDAGNFELPDLKPGNYRLRAQLSGFKTFEADGIELQSNQIRRIDV